MSIERAGRKVMEFPRQHVTRITKLEETSKLHADRILKLEQTDLELAELTRLVRKIVKYIKIGFPAVASAAVTSGIVSGKWGAFFAALLN